MPSRKWHQKSHHGCNTCKSRKIKCDETRPNCKNCMRQSRPCHYSSGVAYVGTFAAVESSAESPQFGTFSLHASPNGSSVPSPTAHQPLHSTTSQPSPPKDLPLPVLPSINCQDLELMHHYTLSTYSTLAHSPTLESIWRDQFPREGFSHPFLLHGLLAVSALHIMLTTSPAQPRLYLDLAIQHHTLAITLYSPVLNAVTPRNCHALFGFSSIAPVISFGVSQASGHTGHDLLQDMIKIFHMLQGITAVVHMALEHVKAGPLGVLIMPLASYDDVVLSSEAADALRLLEERCAAAAADEVGDEGLKAGYEDAIERLRDAFKGAALKKDDRTVAIMWPILVSRSYLDAANDCKPIALAILAHYAVLLHDLRSCWWAGDRGARTVEAITERLGPEWEEVLKWPKMRISYECNGTMI